MQTALHEVERLLGRGVGVEKPPPLSSWWSRGMAARPSANATTHTAITGQRNRYENLPIAANIPITSVAGERLLRTAKDILERNERPRAMTRAYSKGRTWRSDTSFLQAVSWCAPATSSSSV